MTSFYDALLTCLTPVIKFINKIYMPFSRKNITGKDYYIWRSKVNVGDVFLTKTKGELTNLINPTKIKHSAVYVGDIKEDGICYVMEATGDGVVFTDFVTFLTTKDVVVGMKPNFIRDKHVFINDFLETCQKMEGIPYDYLFKKGGKAYYCFELVNDSFKAVYPELQFMCKEIVKGKRIYDENTFLDEKFFNMMFSKGY